jgi:hypothetical protein
MEKYATRHIPVPSNPPNTYIFLSTVVPVCLAKRGGCPFTSTFLNLSVARNITLEHADKERQGKRR